MLTSIFDRMPLLVWLTIVLGVGAVFSVPYTALSGWDGAVFCWLVPIAFPVVGYLAWLTPLPGKVAGVPWYKNYFLWLLVLLMLPPAAHLLSWLLWWQGATEWSGAIYQYRYAALWPIAVSAYFVLLVWLVVSVLHQWSNQLVHLQRWLKKRGALRQC